MPEVRSLKGKVRLSVRLLGLERFLSELWKGWVALLQDSLHPRSHPVLRIWMRENVQPFLSDGVEHMLRHLIGRHSLFNSLAELLR